MGEKARYAGGESLAVGGQAVMEGVMMRDRERLATAVRTPSGKIKVKEEEYVPWSRKVRVLGWPLLRGAASLFEIMIVGTKAMIWSTRQATGDQDESFSAAEIAFTVGLALVLTLVLFKFIPLILASRAQRALQSSNVVFNLIDGGAKILILVVYLALIGMLKDVKRLFGYHGAEHKTINCYEAGKPLTPRSVLSCSRMHPRCGTTFILIVFFISILFYMLIPLRTAFAAKLALRVALLPLVAGVSYELIRAGGRHYDKRLVRVLLTPGLLLQRLTTREPDEEQAAVAIASLKAAVKRKPSRAPRRTPGAS